MILLHLVGSPPCRLCNTGHVVSVETCTAETALRFFEGLFALTNGRGEVLVVGRPLSTIGKIGFAGVKFEFHDVVSLRL